ncbi:MAG: hypothetical protein AVDCRST_MAG93-6763, partial [uncultured Chloroflexia bacterium]
DPPPVDRAASSLRLERGDLCTCARVQPVPPDRSPVPRSFTMLPPSVQTCVKL